MRDVAIRGPLFAGPRRRPPRRLRRVAFLAGSAAAQAGLVAALLVMADAARRTAPRRPDGPIVAVRLVRPPGIRSPAPPPAAGTHAPRSRAAAPRAATPRMVQPKELQAEVSATPLVEAPPPLLATDEGAGQGTSGATGSAGSIDGVVGGSPGGADGSTPGPALPRPVAARPKDLAAVRAGIARTLVYPPNARRNGLQGKVLLEFVLLADGRIRDLLLRSGSGHALLDAAALDAVQAAAPFPAPGVDVLVTVPVVFRSE